MLSSLRSRQLISGFGVIMVGILMLGGMLHWFSYSYKIDQKKVELRETSYDLLGFLNFEEGQFKTSEEKDVEAKAKEMIRFRKLDDVEQNRFAYIIDTKTNDIVWTANTMGKPDQLIEADYLLRFSLKKDIPVSFEPTFDQQKPLPPKDPNKLVDDEVLQQTYSQEYLLAIQSFFHPEYGTFQFVLGISIADIQKEMQDMRQKFAVLLFLSAVLVLIAQLALSFWVVAPIKEFENEVKAIEAGDKDSISEHYPEELLPVKNALNGLLSYEKGQKQRYKDTLDDLAHSIKTPLTAMQNQLDQLRRDANPDAQIKIATTVFESQIERIREIIGHQLRRAMVTNQGAMILSQPVRPVLFRLRETLQKVYRDKVFEIRINVDEYAKCRMDAEDMMELFGNLLNNACRFCKDLVEISAHHDNNMLIIDIDDDGLGFPINNPNKLLQRGIREDSKSDGQGIGMAVSTEIVSAIGGKIELLVSPYVGARVRLHLPV
ncbi:Histidine kinase-, DNA gyrase B-, and HSP90-like ATPase [Thiothrix caldifontis]|uniref:histidine kinase n=1 Tax=Thiothrix caldifontis TaxID=525918 RepID=A0A1H4CKW1_9GAMM|nr:ATP-binding protein [Thiothrix caldifontis]SEA61081.1 Histidine kinase-, DNA gyrase B-, and HSP90-like ATPase [Thiothrix caldifontis]